MEHCSKLSIHTSCELQKLPPDKATHRVGLVGFSLPESSRACIDLRLSANKSTLLQGGKPCVGNTLLNLGCQGKVCFWQPLMEASGFLGRHGPFCNNTFPKRNMRCPVVKRLHLASLQTCGHLSLILTGGSCACQAPVSGRAQRTTAFLCGPHCEVLMTYFFQIGFFAFWV